MQFLDGLNQAQLQAVQHPPEIPLQILAGPGSGKTKVLTSRIAYLISHHALPPASILAVTFTNKAANEMRERLTKLIGKGRTDQVKMGTFHAICALFLRKHATKIGLEGNFTVCDAEESKRIITKLLKPHKEYLSARGYTLKEGTVLSLISRAKAKGHKPHDLLPKPKTSRKKSSSSAAQEDALPNATEDIDRIVSEIYRDYEATLRANNCLDFDDLLVYGVKLFSTNDQLVQWCRHVFVDEFQDTNIMQYDLMDLLARAHHCVTVVGDPDQSIYGWRSAEVANLGKMRKGYPTTQQILLEENYRSTASILRACLAIVAEDKDRIDKSLRTSHPSGPTPVLRSFRSEQDEAAFIAAEIKRLVASMGGRLAWSDFVVLLRFSALSRCIESALQKEGIPSRVLAGHKFFERLEIKDLLAYLQLVDNPRFVPAFMRVINIPARGIGEKTVSELLAKATKMNISPVDVVEQIHDMKIPDIKPTVKRKIGAFVAAIRTLRKLAAEGTSPSDLIRRLIDLVGFELHLKKTQQDWESRWENVQELITFASEVETGLDTGSAVAGDAGSNDKSDKNVELIDLTGEDDSPVAERQVGMDVDDGRPMETTPLRAFLQASMLSTDTESESEESSKEKVTISTCHAAKGLEWPVVMIPAVEKGVFPFARSEDTEEERRLLYVACTRAQSFLYLLHSTKRMVGGMTSDRSLSEFISAVAYTKDPPLFSDRRPNLTAIDRKDISAVLQRPPPDEADVAQLLAEYNRTTRYHVEERPPATSRYSQPSAHQGVDIPTNVPATFSSARVPLQNAIPAATLHAPRPSASTVTHGPARPAPLAPFMSANKRAALIQMGIIAPDRWPGQGLPPPVQAPPQQILAAANRPAPPHSALSLPRLAALPGLQQASRAGENPGPEPVVVVARTKRRLGMGRGVAGYSNKKFKKPVTGE